MAVCKTSLADLFSYSFLSLSLSLSLAALAPLCSHYLEQVLWGLAVHVSSRASCVELLALLVVLYFTAF